MQAAVHARPFEARDAAAVAVIYNQGIAERNATFETDPRTAAEMAEYFAASNYPAVVAERGGTVVGAAWASQYRARRAYADVAEFSVYVARAARGQGVGRIALSALIDVAEQRGFAKLVSRIFPENRASRRLCASLGFREVGVYRRHGKLDGQWRDTVIVERLLGAANRD